MTYRILAVEPLPRCASTWRALVCIERTRLEAWLAWRPRQELVRYDGRGTSWVRVSERGLPMRDDVAPPDLAGALYQRWRRAREALASAPPPPPPPRHVA